MLLFGGHRLYFIPRDGICYVSTAIVTSGAKTHSRSIQTWARGLVGWSPPWYRVRLGGGCEAALRGLVLDRLVSTTYSAVSLVMVTFFLCGVGFSLLAFAAVSFLLF